MTITDKNKTIMVKIGKAIEKGAIQDTRNYLQGSDTITNNALPFVRIDKIYTNLNNMVASESVEVKLFKRSSWTGALVVDRENQMVFSICTKRTLDRIPRNKNRHSPHYAQTMLNKLNREEKAPIKQMTLADYDIPISEQFTEEEYEQDFLAIMKEEAVLYEGYRFWVVAYEVEHFVMVYLTAILMDSNFDVVQEVSILEMLKPNFGDLTIVMNEKKEENVRNLLSVKTEVVAKNSFEPIKHTEILPKVEEENMKA